MVLKGYDGKKKKEQKKILVIVKKHEWKKIVTENSLEIKLSKHGNGFERIWWKKKKKKK